MAIKIFQDSDRRNQMAIKFLKNFAPPEPLTKFRIKKLTNNLSIFDLAAFYIFTSLTATIIESGPMPTP